MKMTDLGCVELQVGLTCDGCKETIAINGPRRAARCAGCQKIMALDGAYRWQALLDFHTPSIDVFKRSNAQKDGATEEGTWAPVKLTSTRAWPKCKCGRRFEATKLAGVMAAGFAVIGCPACAVEINVDRPPPSFRAAFPAVLAFVGAEVVPENQADDKLRAAPQRVAWWALFDRSRA